MSYEIHNMDCRLAMAMLVAPDSVDAIVTDPPYGLSKEPDAAEVLRHWLNGDDYKHDGNGFMGKSWDSFVPGPSVWKEVYRTLKPGAFLLAFFGTRTYDLGVMAIRLAGFEIRDEIAWCYGSGFPKSLDVSKAIDKAAGAVRETVGANPNHRAVSGVDYEGTYAGGNTGAANLTAPATDEAIRWQGWGTALKPAHEPIVVARKPLAERTVAANVQTWGTGGLNIDASRVAVTDESYARNHSGDRGHAGTRGVQDEGSTNLHAGGGNVSDRGRFPANLIHDGSDEVAACFPSSTVSRPPSVTVRSADAGNRTGYGTFNGQTDVTIGYGDSGSAARFFKSCPLDDEDVQTQRLIYCAKASRSDRDEGLDGLPPRAAVMQSETSGQHITRRDEGYVVAPRANHHATVKPTSLMRYLVRLVTPPGGTVLDPFTGSGTTGKAALLEGFDFIGCELDADYVTIAEARCAHALFRRSAA